MRNSIYSNLNNDCRSNLNRYVVFKFDLRVIRVRVYIVTIAKIKIAKISQKKRC